MSFSPDKEQRIFNNRIEQLRRREHIPAQIIDIVVSVCLRQIDARQAAAPAMPAESELAAPEMHAQGAPLLERERFPYEKSQSSDLFFEFADLLQQIGGPAATASGQIVQAVNDETLDLNSLFFSFIKGDDTLFESWTKKTPDAPRTLSFLTQSSLSPFLAAVGDALIEHHAPDKVWTHNHCPTCGSLPLIGHLRDKEGYRYASCSFCQTDYRIPRMACVYCGEDDHEKLSYFTADDEVGYRVDVCESCKMYFKAADFREMDKHVFPLLDDLESLTLDILAANEGYSRPTLSALGF